MSLVDGARGAVAAAVKTFVDELEAGGREDRAVLLNLREEDRLPKTRRAAFQKALAAATGTAPDKLREACKSGGRALRVLAKKRPKVQPEWRTYMTLDKLQRHGFVSGAAVDPSAAPPRLPLTRRWGSDGAGNEYPFWITTMTDGGDADEVRDRLGLAHLPAGEVLYRVAVHVDDKKRPLHVPSAIDAGFSPPWRRPPKSHSEPWGLTRDLRDDRPAEPELLATPNDADERSAHQVGLLRRSPPTDYLVKRIP
ncbi:MAG: hypothetical protein IPM54_42355 [Polyangiaceae bacterium]|nr:hypothetical protein [Polyangiaceae bacterium]